MIIFFLSSFILAIKIHKAKKSLLSSLNPGNNFHISENVNCPTYSSSQKPITTSCSSKSMSYTKDSYEPAFVVDSSKNSLTIDLQDCNFSHYKLTALGIYSLIHITGSNSVSLNVFKCNFNENKFPYSSGIFFTSSGDHIITIISSNFIQNEGSKATILSDTCSILTMTNCYIAYNKCDYYQGQIYLKARTNSYGTITANIHDDSANFLQISFSSCTFLLNECMTTNSILLEGYKSISFDKCSFSCGGTPKHFIELKGHDIVASFKECCFYGYFKYYSYDYYHIYFAYTFGNKANFIGINSFGGEKMNSINYSPPDEGNANFKIDECVHVAPTATSTPTASKIQSTISPSISPSMSPTKIATQSQTSSPSITFTPDQSSVLFTSEVVLSFTEATSESSSDTDNDHGFDKSIFKKPWFMIMIVFIVVALIAGFIVGWFLSKSCNRKADYSMKLNTSDTFHNTLLSD